MTIGELMVRAQSGDKEIQYRLGLYYLINNDLSNARVWIFHSSAQGHSSAHELLKELNALVH
jgi:hypothetical protein